MKIGAPIRILIVAALCIAALIGLVLREGMARDGGTEVLMTMEAVDPRALLGGHFVIINLGETLEPGEACPAALASQPEFWPWDNAPLPDTWVALAPAAQHHRAVGVFENREAALQAGAVAVRGRAHCAVAAQPPPRDGEAEEPAPRPFIRTDLGVDRFYVNQTEAERIERVMRDREDGVDVIAIISIGGDGRGRLKGLVVDGERLELGWT